MDKFVTLRDFQEMVHMKRASLAHDTQKPNVQKHVVDGIALPPGVDTIVRDLKDFEVREDDAWIVTYPKAGTTWTQEIMSCVMHDGNLEEVNKIHTFIRVPYLDFTLPEHILKAKNTPQIYKILPRIASPRVIKSHLPGQLLPPQLWEKKPKIVYVMRNPKDVVVSYFHFTRKTDRSPQRLAQTFGDFLDELLRGKFHFGPLWEHYLYFWKKRHEPNVLVLRFEDMKKDLRGIVEQISKFLGKDLSPETLDAITEHCTFANMKKNPMANPDTLFALAIKEDQQSSSTSFMRKGQVGGWKSHFTVAQNEAMDALMKEKLHSTGLTFDSD